MSNSHHRRMENDKLIKDHYGLIENEKLFENINDNTSIVIKDLLKANVKLAINFVNDKV